MGSLRQHHTLPTSITAPGKNTLGSLRLLVKTFDKINPLATTGSQKHPWDHSDYLVATFELVLDGANRSHCHRCDKKREAANDHYSHQQQERGWPQQLAKTYSGSRHDGHFVVPAPASQYHQHRHVQHQRQDDIQIGDDFQKKQQKDAVYGNDALSGLAQETERADHEENAEHHGGNSTAGQ